MSIVLSSAWVMYLSDLHRGQGIEWVGDMHCEYMGISVMFSMLIRWVLQMFTVKADGEM